MWRYGTIAVLTATLPSWLACYGGDGTWNRTGGGNWNDVGSWLNAVPNGIGDSATFGPSLPIAAASVNLNSSIVIGSLSLDNPVLITVAGSNTLVFDNAVSAANASIDVAAGRQLTITSPVQWFSDSDLSIGAAGVLILQGSQSGSGDLTKLGTGSAIIGPNLSGNNSAWSGQLFVNAGTARIGGATGNINALGASAVATTVADSATLDVSGAAAAGNVINSATVFREMLNLSGMGDNGAGALRFTNNNLAALTGTVTLVGEASIAVAGAGILHIGDPGGVVSGGAIVGDALVKSGGDASGMGKLQINVAAGHIGGTTVDSGTLTVGARGSLVGTGNITVNSAGRLEVFEPAGGNVSNHSVSLNSVLLNGGTFVLGTSFNPGAYFNSSSTGGTLLFNANNTGTINLSTILGGTDDGDKIRIGAIDAQRTVSGTVRFNNGATHRELRVGGGEFNDNFHRLTITSNLLATNHVDSVRVESGILELTGNNTYAGQTIIDGGELWIQGTNALGTTSGTDADATIINAGGALRFATGGATSGNEKLILAGGTLRAGGSAVNGPIVVNAPSRIIGGDMFGAISGVGELTLGSGLFGMELRGANSYTGKTLIGALGEASVEVHHANALGDTAEGTVVTGGRISLFATVDEPILADSGEILLKSASYGGPLTLRGGDLRTEDAATLTSTVNLDGGRSRIISPGSFDRTLTLGGGVSGTGDLDFAGIIAVNGPLSYSGNVIVSFGTVMLNIPSSLNGELTVAGGELIANENLVADLRLKRGAIKSAAGKAITSINPVVEVQGAGIGADLFGVTTINKISSETANLSNIGQSNDAALFVHEGTVRVSGDHGLGSTVGVTTVASPRDAVLEFTPGLVINEDINLNNASGLDHTGALSLYDTAGFTNRTTILSGTIDLGDQGSFIGVSSRGTIQIDGPVTGGDLSVIGGTGTDPGTLRLDGSSNTSTGATIISPDGTRKSVFSVGPNGTLTTTSRVEVYNAGVFEIDTDGAPANTNRISDGIPIYLKGGGLRLRGDFNSGSSSAETVGAVIVTQGASEVECANIQSNTTVDLTIASLTRHAGATVHFARSPDASWDVFIDNPPPLVNGIIGAWATARHAGNKLDFASYDSVQGVIALSEIGRPSQVQGAGMTDNVRSTGAPLNSLTANTTLNSLSIDTSGLVITPVNLDLGGHQLNVLSGGILRYGSNQEHTSLISNGTLTAGGSALNAELLVHIDQATVTLSANITDNPGGAVGLTRSGGTLILSGNNTYTGPTVINEGTTRITSASSLPSNTNVTIDGGTLDNQSGTTLNIGNLILRGSGGISRIDADSYQLYSGSTGLLAGGGPMTKLGPGQVKLSGDNSAYSGAIDVQEGMLSISHRKSLGLSTPNVHTGATISTFGEEDDFDGSIHLTGGKFAVLAGTDARPTTFHGNVSITLDSIVQTSNTGAINMLTLDPGVMLTKQGSGSLRLNGFTSVGDGSEFFVKLGTLELLQTLVSDSPTDTLVISGPQASSLGSDSNVILNASGYDGNTELHDIDAYLRRVDAIANGVTTVYDGSRLIVEVTNAQGNVVLDGGELVVPDGYTFVGTVTNSGIVSPGSSPGILTISGSYVQDTSGRLEVEIASPSLLDVTYKQLNDAVRASGAAILSGELDIVLLHDYIPEPGDSFEILRYGSRVGTFDTITGHLLGEDLFFDLVYDSDSLTLVAMQADPGDADADGDVDLSDLGALATYYGKSSAASWRNGDFDHDGDVDLSDLGTLATHYEEGRAQAYADFESLIAVPEPVFSAAALSLGFIALQPRNLRRGRKCS